jgi:predicted NACHT family NTPase
MDECNKIIPYIDGSTKEDISKWFDFVFYTKTRLKKSGEREYVWVTKRCEIYDHAKDRTNLLPAEIPQNYQLVLEAAKSKGFDGVKVLIIGAPGSGKTLSLKTLKQGGSNENNND